MWTPSLRVRLTLAYVALAIVCTVALGAAGLALQQRAYREHLRERLTTAALVAAEPLTEELDAGRLGPLVQRLATVTQAQVTVLAPTGVVLADSADPSAVGTSLAGQPEVEAALRGPATASVRQSAAHFYVAVPVRDGETLIGVIRFATPLAEMEAALRQIGLVVIGLTLLGAVLTALITLVVSRALTVPLHELTSMVRRLATGQFRERLPVRSHDELGQLAESVNRMADELDRTIGAISDQRDQMSALLSGMPDAVVVVDRQLRVQRINQAALRLFRPAGSVTDMPLIELTRDHELVNAVAESLRTQLPTRQLIERAVQPRFLSVTTTPIAAGRLVGALITIHDVTEVRRLEQIRRQFVANVSHELRTPLSNIKLMVETLQEDPADAALVGDFLARINTEVDSLTQLVRELLELAQIESGQAPLVREREWLAHLVQQAVDRLRPQAERQGVTLTVEASLAALPPVEVDRQRLVGVLVNLIHNAIKFTPPGGAITLGGEVGGEEVRVWVRDTGLGIPPAELPRIFERFYKVDKSRTTGGTGLGLAIVKHTIQAHGGRVWAESTYGQGSTFVFTLPLQPQPATAAGPPAALPT